MRILFFVLGYILATHGVGQTARQGDQKSDPTEFHSPMVVEAPFIAANPVFWNRKTDSSVTSRELVGLRRFHCDGVSIVGVLLQPKEVSGDRILTVADLSISNPGHDKFVKLFLELLNGDEKIGEASIGPFKVKEGGTIRQSARLVALKANLKTDPMTTLRVTMTNWDY